MDEPSKPSASARNNDVIEVPRRRLLRLSFMLEALAHTREPAFESDCSARRGELISYARSAMQRRQARKEHFAKAIIGEPAWDLLLILYVADGIGEAITVTEAADRARLASTSAKRWIEYLEKERLVHRRPHERDGRRIALSLSTKGRRSLDSYFCGIVCTDR
ncbi:MULTISPECIES: MarR family transcriptional regulator [Sphingomonas]|uniref:MarR family transcriptional regulator n=1 Tax=Sphingomonas TaxID=13687 RepID=UPI00126A1ADF|nr:MULTISPECIES: MarR family transcriptional regulator [Sphingomonas]